MEDYSTAEIVRLLKASQAELAEMRRDIAANHAALLKQMHDQRAEIAREYVRQDVYERDRLLDEQAGTTLAEKVAALTSLKDWVIRIVLTTVILAVLGLVVYSGAAVPS